MATSGPNNESRPVLWVTTSWDDGYPLDLRVADLLDHYGIPGTFYVPVRSHLPVLGPGQIRDLARRFEIGGHTVDHVRLDQISPDHARAEIFGSKARLEDVTGSPCRMFAPPSGYFRRSHLAEVREAGYAGVRTVELLSTAQPELRDGLVLLPTTVQIYRHRAPAYFRNAIKRRRWGSLKTYFLHARSADPLRITESLLDSLVESGGVFHLWGHSWELEHSRLWGALESILKRLHARRDQCRFVSNSSLCDYFGRTAEPVRGSLSDLELLRRVR